MDKSSPVQTTGITGDLSMRIVAIEILPLKERLSGQKRRVEHSLV